MHEWAVESDAEQYAGDESFDNAVNDAEQPFGHGRDWIFAIGWECTASVVAHFKELIEPLQRRYSVAPGVSPGFVLER
jgi:hypothetical protein